jgi:hypothetical protein
MRTREEVGTHHMRRQGRQHDGDEVVRVHYASEARHGGQHELHAVVLEALEEARRLLGCQVAEADDHPQQLKPL